MGLIVRKKQLGDSGLWLPVLGLGTVKIGRNEKVKYPNAFDLPNDQTVIDLLHAAKELGITLIDTAPAYGNSEERLGRLLPRSRDQWCLMTKVGEEFTGGESRFDFSPEFIEFSVKRSLKRLRTDYLDLVLLHSDGNDIDIIRRCGALEVLESLKSQGYLRFSGMSTKTVEGGLLALEKSDVVMVAYHLEDRTQLPVIQRAEELQKGILIKKAFSSGHLVGSGAIRQVLQEVLAYPAVTSVVTGTLNIEHLKENALFVI